MSGLTRDELANLAIGLPIVTAIVGALAGLGLGFGLGWGLKPAPQAQAQAAAAFTADQITFKCGQVKGEELKNATARIKLLEAERDEFTARVAALEAQLKEEAAPAAPVSAAAARPRQDNSRLARELEAARRQLDDVQQQLGRAREEKRQLQEALRLTTVQLQQTEAALDLQIEKTEDAVDDAAAQAWWRFLGDAQLDICEKGNRKKLGRCREEVQAALGQAQIKRSFTHCVRSGQATPVVEVLPQGEVLPRHAQYLGEESRVTRDWVVRLCDPTLPEARMGPR